MYDIYNQLTMNIKNKQTGAPKFNYQELLHHELYGSLPSASRKSLPVLKPTPDIFPIRLLPFHEAYAHKTYTCTVHFFINDNHFLRVLRDPEKYLDFFKKCHSVIGPDLSQYSDMSEEDRYLSAYVNRAFSLYLQNNGVRVIPNCTWSLPDSYEYSFSGIPQNTTIAVNSNGVLKHNVSKYLWLRGYKTACDALKPSTIIRYGSYVPNENTSISIYFDNERIKNLHYGSKR